MKFTMIIVAIILVPQLLMKIRSRANNSNSIILQRKLSYVIHIPHLTFEGPGANKSLFPSLLLVPVCLACSSSGCTLSVKTSGVGMTSSSEITDSVSLLEEKSEALSILEYPLYRLLLQDRRLFKMICHALVAGKNSMF